MANTKISALPVAGALAGTEPVPIVQDAATKKTTVQDIADLVTPGVPSVNGITDAVTIAGTSGEAVVGTAGSTITISTIARDTITTGASPTAASPETNITEVVSGGTDAIELITLAIPSSPQTKLGRIKTFVFKTKTSSGDQIQLSPTTFVGTGADDDTSDFYSMSSAGDLFICRLVYGEQIAVPGYGWQAVVKIQEGFENVFASRVLASSGPFAAPVILTAGNSTGGDDGGPVVLNAGNSVDQNGGKVQANPGMGDVNGGDFEINLPNAGSGRKGLVVVNGMPTADPLVEGALFSLAGVIKISAG